MDYSWFMSHTVTEMLGRNLVFGSMPSPNGPQLIMGCTLEFFNVLGYQYYLPSQEQYLVAMEVAKKMPSYPQQGFIQEIDGMLVVKISDNLDYILS